jgi:tRNA uridine 5-carboxymethylaminomethyl modification enzyme
MQGCRFEVVVIGGGHAGVEAAWAAANLFHIEPKATPARVSPPVAIVTLDPGKIGEMSCNPAIGGLAKGQLVREVDALGGLMGLAADATGIHFKVLNASKGAAVQGPRCQSDRHRYAAWVRGAIARRAEIAVLAGSVEEFLVERAPGELVPRCVGVAVRAPGGDVVEVRARAVVLTTGTFMRGLMHTGERRTPGGRAGEGPAASVSGALERLGFELGRLKTGTPPRLLRGSIDWERLPRDEGDAQPTAFSELSGAVGNGQWATGEAEGTGDRGSGIGGNGGRWVADRFPELPQVACRQTRTSAAAHELIRANLHRAPMFSGQIESRGPRYCPSIEDKAVRFAERESHGVFLEPEGLDTDWVYCNGIATSLPEDIQDVLVRTMPGCERAEIVRYGYAVEYDMVRPHQIEATGQSKLVRGLFLAGQINGTSGYEEAAAQGVVAGVNAARRARGEGDWVLGREEAYIGVLMDDLVTKTPTEPYRMFTSRAEHRLLLRADNAPERLTPVARGLGLLSGTELGRARVSRFEERSARVARLSAAVRAGRVEGVPVERLINRSESEWVDLKRWVAGVEAPDAVWKHVFAEFRYAVYIERERGEIRRRAEGQRRAIPAGVDYAGMTALRSEARQALARFRPTTFGQAARLEGMTPADVSLLAVLLEKGRRGAE